jgi:hypothetical protein
LPAGVTQLGGSAFGGALSGEKLTVSLANCVLGLNLAGGGTQFLVPGSPLAFGGAIYCRDAFVNYSTIASNSTTIWADYKTTIPFDAAVSSTNGVITVHASIISNEGTNVSGAIIDNGYNLVSDGNDGFTNASTRTNVSAGLASFEIPNGALGYFPLVSGSLDAADPASFPESDLLGSRRPFASRAGHWSH